MTAAAEGGSDVVSLLLLTTGAVGSGEPDWGPEECPVMALFAGGACGGVFALFAAGCSLAGCCTAAALSRTNGLAGRETLFGATTNCAALN